MEAGIVSRNDMWWTVLLVFGILSGVFLGYIGLVLYSIGYARLRYISKRPTSSIPRFGARKTNLMFLLFVIAPIGAYFLLPFFSNDFVMNIVSRLARLSVLPGSSSTLYLDINNDLNGSFQSGTTFGLFDQVSLYLALQLSIYLFVLTSFAVRKVDPRCAPLYWMTKTNAKTLRADYPRAGIDTYKMFVFFAASGIVLISYRYGFAGQRGIENFGKAFSIWGGFNLLIFGLWIAQFAVPNRAELELR